MIDVKVAQQQVAGVVREVLRRFHDPVKRAEIADSFVLTIESVEADMMRKMGPAPVIAHHGAAKAQTARAAQREVAQ